MANVGEYESPVHDTYDNTTKMYVEVTSELLSSIVQQQQYKASEVDGLAYRPMRLIFATHSENTVLLVAEQ